MSEASGIDPRQRFSATADDYRKFRPDYPVALFDWLVALPGLGAKARVADIGCGTGISTRQLAARGFDAVGIDPNAKMLAFAKEALGGPAYRQGEAAATGLPDASVDLATAAQAFHWFDIPSTMKELRRILQPGGWCAAFWNVRATEGPFLSAYEALLLERSATYPVADESDVIASIRTFPGLAEVREATFPHRQAMDREAFLGRVHSASYVQHGVKDMAAFDTELGRLFERFRMDGKVAFDYETKVIAWRFEG